MTERSYLWDGVITGDATLAPYDKESFNTFMMLLYNTPNTVNEAYVVPGYAEDLRVYSDESGMAVIVGPGSAVTGGPYIFISNESVPLNIDSVQTSGYFRYDFVVLRVDTTEQKIRLAVVKGSETNSYATLVDPTLTQNDLIREIPLAKLYVTDETPYLPDKYVYDMRDFSTNAHVSNYFMDDSNLVVNSENLVGFSGWSYNTSEASGAGLLWTAPSSMSRGYGLLISDGYYSRQVIPINSNQRTYTVKTVMSVTATDAKPYIALYPAITNKLADGGTILPGTYKKQEYTNLDSDAVTEFTEREIQFTVTFDENESMDSIILEIGCETSSGGAIFGQIIVVPGYHPGPFREFNETVMRKSPITQVVWSDAAMSTGTTLITLYATFGAPRTVKGVFVRLRGRDSGSLAGSASIEVQGYAAPYNMVYGRLELDGVANDVYRESTFYIPVDAHMYYAQNRNGQFRVNIVATGVLTFDATLEIIGIVT